MKIGIVGIGHMGKNISRRLAAHFELVLYNRTYEKALNWAEQIGAQAVRTLTELQDCEIILLVLPAKETANCVRLFNQWTRPVQLVNLATSVPCRELQAIAAKHVQILCAKIISHAVEMDRNEKPLIIVDTEPAALSEQVLEVMSYAGDVLPGDTDLVGRVNTIAARLALESCIELEARIRKTGVTDERIIKQAMAQVAPGTMKACALGLLGPFALDIVEQIKLEKRVGE